MESFIVYTGALLTALTIIKVAQEILIPHIKNYTTRKKGKKEKACAERKFRENELNEIKELCQKCDANGERLQNIENDIQQHTNTIHLMQHAVLAMMKRDLLNLIRQHLDDGYILLSDLEVLEGMFKSYEENHGNSFMGSLMIEVRKLPKKDD